MKPAKIVDKKLYIDIDKQKIVDMKDIDKEGTVQL